MFELIRANKRRSILLMATMLALLLAVGFSIGFVAMPSTTPVVIGSWRYYLPVGGLIGMAAAFFIWGVQALAAYAAGGQILMAAAGAKEIQKRDYPQLFNVVEEMTLAARLPAMPKVYVIEDMSLNAFAAGRDPDHASVAVTAGLLSKLNRDQLQGVVAHEIAHIANRDVLFMTMAGIMLGSIIMITEMFLRMMWYSSLTGTRRYSARRSRDGDGAAKALMLVVALILAIVAPLLAQLLYFACSRRREYLADAGGAVYTRSPEGLASALEVIAGNPGAKENISKAMAPMYIVNPLEAGRRSFSALGSTHPPIEERVRILRSMAGGASFGEYAHAWGKVSGKSHVHMPVGELQGTEPVGISNKALQVDAGEISPAASAFASAHPVAEPDARQRHRDVGDLLRRINQFRFVSCACGLQLKIPPEYSRKQVKCPRCGAVHEASGR